MYDDGLRRALGGSSDYKRFFTLDDARSTYEELKHLNKKDFSAPGKITTIPYLGIGEAPARPGGNINFLGRVDFEDLATDFLHSSCKRNFLKGCIGIGKSCYLRAFAAGLIRDSLQQDQRTVKLRVVCIWEVKSALDSLAEAVRNALLFAYCNEDPAVLTTIHNLATVAEMIDFVRVMVKQNDRFCFIVDGAEILGSQGCPELEELANLGVAYYGVSPTAEVTDAVEVKTDEKSLVITLERGFFGSEMVHYMKDLSVLGKIVAKFPEFWSSMENFAGHHPLFLSILDRCFREVARNKVVRPGLRVFPAILDDDMRSDNLDAEDVVKHIEHTDDIGQALALFTSAAELKTIRVSLQHLLADPRIQGELRSIDDMVEVDCRYVIFQKGAPAYCTYYIREIYLQEFRARKERLFEELMKRLLSR